WDVDRVLFDFGFPMGQFAMADLAGLDIGWNKKASKGSTLREVMCELGRFGQKSGGGFYDYDANRNATPSPVAEKAIREFVARSGVTPRKISDEEILDRLILPMIDEGAKILDEGKAIRSSDIDVIWVMGYGWPVYRGGPMYYADQLGLAAVADRMRTYEKSLGRRFAPSSLLEKLAAEGKRFADLKS
ncbi:MAG: 3-hydroxyacyl-CoA dehydrogenase family protein, partial [Phenylobacterium sp.]|uniref:3-hydroxyacyl-CoA dehydrogenase family protein n=1 Tax=Phenylobacterium sp. TaxID=1871053 RepID=UPI00273606BF